MKLLFRKVMRDFNLNRTRSVLVILAIFLGVLGTGLILDCYAITKREMDVSYMNTNPASFTIRVDPVDANLEQALENFPEIKSYEVRRMIRARTSTAADDWQTTELYVIDDFNNIRINTFSALEGAATPGVGEISIENAALSVADVSLGDPLTIKIPLNSPETLLVSGSVKAPGMHPAWMDALVYGFITPDTLALLGAPSDASEILFVVSGDRFDEAYIHDIAVSVKNWCADNGYSVSRITVPTPGQHPNGDQMNAILFLFEAFGMLSLFLSCVLVFNIITALLSGQIKEIGIIKGIGGNSFQIAGMYYFLIALFGAIAVLFAIPMAGFMSRSFVDLSAEMLNFTVSSYSIPLWSYLLQLAAGLVIPALAATLPILKGCGISVNEALSDVGQNKNQFGSSFLDRSLGKIGGFNLSVLLSIRNTFRKQGRLILTIGTLAIGGAMFIIAINVQASLGNTFDNALTDLNFDAQYVFSQNYSEEAVAEVLSEMPDIKSVDYLSGSMASFVYADGTESNSFQGVGLPPDMDSLALPMIAGRWISPADTNVIVLNQALSAHEPKVDIGDTILFKANGITAELTVIGIVKEVAGSDKAYLSQDYYQQIFSQDGAIRSINVTYQQLDDPSLLALRVETEKILKENNLDVLTGITIRDAQAIMGNHLISVSGFLMIAALLVIIVGTMGLISSTGMNVMERLRETGIMRSLGASQQRIFYLMMIENLVTGLISWVIAGLLAFPLSILTGNIFGNIFLKLPLDNVYRLSGAGIWLILILLITIIVSFVATRKSLRLPINEVLAYE